MRVIKPLKVGVITRCFEVKREHFFGVTACLYFPLDRPREIEAEAAMWLLLGEELGKDAALDAGIPKARAEALVSGAAFPPGGQPAQTCPVRLRIGEIDKTLYVIGDRRWVKDVPTDPVPFSAMPITWDRAFGGPGYPKNPLGKGHEAIEGEEGPVHPLPNIENKGSLITSPRARPEPAGFGPLDIAWPQRTQKAGTYDQTWLQTLFPGFAADIDWTIFNLTLPDQQQATFFRGDEAYTIEHMHPTKAKLEGHLPGYRARAFVTRGRSFTEGAELHEVPLRLSTIWLFPGRDRGVLLFQGSVKVLEDDGRDVFELMLAADPIEAPRPLDHYRAVLARRLDPENGYLFQLKDSELVPPGCEGMGKELEELKALTATEGLVRKNQRKKADAEIEKSRALLREHDLDPDEHGPKPLPPEEAIPSLEELPAFMAQKEAEAKREAEAHKQEIEARDLDLEKIFEEHGLDFEVIREERREVSQGPPTFTADGQRAYYRDLSEEMTAAGHPVEELDHYATDEGFYRQWQLNEAQAKEGYRVGAHHASPAPALSPEESDRVRERVKAAHAAGASMSGWDLTGADLHGLDLRGADLRSTFLESANLEETDLRGVNFTSAVLARASLGGAKIAGASFDHANLGGARLICSSIEGGPPPTFREATLSKANFTGMSLRGVDLSGANLLEIILRETDLSAIKAPRATFLTPDLEAPPGALPIATTDFQGLRFVGADLTSAIFLQADLRGADFSQAQLDDATFIRCRGEGASFAHARLGKARFVEGCCFSGASFEKAWAEQCNFRETDLREANLRGLLGDKVDLSGCDLRGANLDGAFLREALLIRADLRGASLQKADLFAAILQKSDLGSADLSEANLYRADFALVRSDGETILQGSNRKKVRVHPRREP